MLKIGSLCTGYGGLDMAVEEYFGAETVWVSEIDKYASQVIELRLNKPNLGDLKKIDWANVEPIDILTAGYPCQPFSTAGNRKGTKDARHIWPNIREGISILRPNYVILENVRGHLSLGFKEVLKDLAEIGYDAKWQIVRASDVGAPHRRERLFVIAQPTNAKSWRSGNKSFRISEKNAGTGCDNKFIANTNRDEQPRNWETSKLGCRFNTRDQMRLQNPPDALDLEEKLNPKFVEYMMGLPEGWVTDAGLSRTQQLKMLGNGVVPQQALFALSQIMR